jgi:hypothetical protein
MSFVHGKGLVTSIGGNAMTAYSTSVEFERTADSHDVTTFGATAHAYQAGLTDGTATLEGIYDNTASTGPQAVLRPLVGAAAVALVYRPEGTGTGRPTSTVNVIVTSYKESSPVADMITFSADLQFTGAITDTTQ